MNRKRPLSDGIFTDVQTARLSLFTPLRPQNDLIDELSAIHRTTEAPNRRRAPGTFLTESRPNMMVPA